MSLYDPTAQVTSSGTIIQVPTEQPVARFRLGQVVAGIYRIDRTVGEGGMGTVFGATHLPTGRVVALKMLQPDAAAEESTVGRFWREVRAMSRLTHPNVVRVFDVGTLADNTPYMAMELLDGETLAERMRKLGPMPLATAKGFLSQACAAVAAAHTIGVVHRDLKPENMFLTRGEGGTEVLKVLDFGISKAMRATVADDQQKLTKTTDVFGSPTYMSPEQLKASRDVDGRADVWSLGVLLHEMLAGVPPFEGRSVAEIFGAILYKQPEPLSRIRPDIPPEIERAVQRALEKDREKRFASVDELYAAVMGKPGTVARAPEPRATSRPTVMIAAVALCAIAGLVSFLLARWLM